jgi:hypothetical protein
MKSVRQVSIALTQQIVIYTTCSTVVVIAWGVVFEKAGVASHTRDLPLSFVNYAVYNVWTGGTELVDSAKT